MEIVGQTRFAGVYIRLTAEPTEQPTHYPTEHAKGLRLL
jgi:hypothetical protein